ncbi:PREDICTED: C-X-C chemokine receptor type 6 [Gekko japonicus]|uniref:C-X-C chemokine receptor type 6 n=1 Tax=Gekko japonicus TaxID=146911 RepID=A0ABM1LDR9_GEKJA|nr:PREDICTED: C-X-C chemokine receptor type 6 [Gekko japonicus]
MLFQMYVITDMSTDEDYYAYLSEVYKEDYDSDFFPRFSKVFLICMYSFACIFGVSGNALVLIIFVFYEKVKTVTDIFLVSLATADLCFLGTLPFWAYSAAHEWIFGTLACQVIRGFYTLNLYGSMLTLTCVTIERYFSVVQATKVHISQSKRTIWGKVICIFLWIVSLAFALPQFTYSTQAKHDKVVCRANYSSLQMEQSIEVTQMSLGFFCPMLVMLFCYFTIINTLLKAKGFNKHKSVKIVFAIVMTFICTQAPYNLLKLIRVMDRHVLLSKYYEYALIITEAIAYFHSCLNPVLYFFIGVKFRKNLKKIVKNIRCAGRQQMAKQWQTTEDGGSKTCTASNNVEETSLHLL